MFPQDIVPFPIADSGTHDTAESLEPEGALRGLALAGSLSLQPPLEENPSLLLAEVGDGRPHRPPDHVV
jgi:hypothetical protein